MAKASQKKKAAERAGFVRELMADSVLNEQALNWPVARQGYDWRRVEEDRLIYPREGEFRDYSPGTLPDLFKRFAELEQTERSFTTFANSYGRLGIYVPLVGSDSVKSSVVGEPWSKWCDAQQSMALAVRLWRARRDRDANEIICRHVFQEQLIADPSVLDSEERVLWVCPDPKAKLGFTFPMLLRERTAIGAAKQFVRRWVTDGLKGHTSVQVVWHEKRQAYTWRVRPRTLLGVMWWQLGRALCEKVTVGTCKFCTKPLEIGPSARRSSTKFCNVNCRMSHFRKEQRLRKSQS